MSTYTGVTNFQKTLRFFGPPCMYICPQFSSTWSEGETTWAISKRLVTLLNYMRYINNFIYLYIYLSISMRFDRRITSRMYLPWALVVRLGKPAIEPFVA